MHLKQEFASLLLWMEEFLHHQKDAWKPINNNGMFTTYQLVQDFFHPQ